MLVLKSVKVTNLKFLKYTFRTGSHLPCVTVYKIYTQFIWALPQPRCLRTGRHLKNAILFLLKIYLAKLKSEADPLVEQPIEHCKTAFEQYWHSGSSNRQQLSHIFPNLGLVTLGLVTLIGQARNLRDPDHEIRADSNALKLVQLSVAHLKVG